MAKWNFPPLDPFDYVGAIRALASEDVRPVRDQHVVSQVLLKKFTAIRGSRGHMLGRFDKIAKCRLHEKGTGGCGYIRDFVQYASRSAEELWHGVENKLGPAIRAVEAGVLHQENAHLDAIKDAIALHFVRSPVYRRVHETSFEQGVFDVREELLTNRRDLWVREFRRRYGLEPAGPEALELLISRPLQEWRELEASGALLRVSLERNFHRVRTTLDETSVQVLHAPLGKEFLISDCPAFTFVNKEGGGFVVRMAVGDSHGIALPVSRKCVVTISGSPSDEMISPYLVDSLNRIQVQIAERQIYYHPGSSLDRFVEETLGGNTSVRLDVSD
jgi:hypothetical protein